MYWRGPHPSRRPPAGPARGSPPAGCPGPRGTPLASRGPRPAPHRQDAAPRDAEAVRVEPQVGEQRDVFGGAAVVIAGDVPRVAVGGEPRRVGEAVPDARPRAVGERRALDLVRGRRGAPEEPLGEANHFTHGPSWRA